MALDYYDKLRVKPGTKVDLSKHDPDFTGSFNGKAGKKAAKEQLAKNLAEINALQTLMYAEQKHAQIFGMQAMDAGGKDGTIKTVFGAINPQGCHTYSFKAPNTLEAQHDYFWRFHAKAPALGEVVILNRTYYEDVLIVRLHDLVPERLKEQFTRASGAKTFDEKAFWESRYAQINNMERMFTENGTHILKFFLHISPEEQLERFADRVFESEKNWKLSPADFDERAHWDDYQKLYEDALSKCSTDTAPWFIIPANKKWFRDLAVSEIVLQHLKSLDMKYPEPKVDVEELKRKYFPNGHPGR